jgi:hypothetical protein
MAGNKSVVEIDSLEHAKSVLKALRSTSASQRQYQQIGADKDGHVFRGVDDFNKVVKTSKDTMIKQKLDLNSRFGNEIGGYSESEIIRTTFDTGGDMSGFDYDSFGDRSPQKAKASGVSVDELRISADFKKMLSTSVYGGGEGGGTKKQQNSKDEFGIDDDDDDDGMGDLTPPIVPNSSGRRSGNNGRNEYEQEEMNSLSRSRYVFCSMLLLPSFLPSFS